MSIWMGILVYQESEGPTGCRQLIGLIQQPTSRWQQCEFEKMTSAIESSEIVFCRRVFDQGLPEQFGFVTTFRNRKNSRRRWHAIRITDSRGQPQFAVALNPARKTVEFSIPKYDRTLQTLTWDVPQVQLLKASIIVNYYKN
jgi:hypothetical protein